MTSTEKSYEALRSMPEQCNHCKQFFLKREIQNLLGSDFEIIARVCSGCYSLLV